MEKKVVICCYPDGVDRVAREYAVVAIDVIRATTTAVTAVAMGRRCYPVSTVAAAMELAKSLRDPLLVGEIGGEMPPGFHLNNSPHAVASRTDVSRPMILLSSSGTLLIDTIRHSRAAYVGSFRNYPSMIDHLARHHPAVALIGSASQGEFREEDQMCCAWIADGLIRRGYVPEDDVTARWVDTWKDASRDGFLRSKSVDYLRRSHQLQDLDFILDHFADVGSVQMISGAEIRSVAA